jgi:hypothetical protein
MSPLLARSLVVVFSLAACSSKPAATPPAPDAAARVATPATQPAPTPVEAKPRVREPAVFVDGAPRGVIAFGELPPTLKTVWLEGDDGRKLRRFELYAYLEALGIPMARVKEVHLHGGRRVGILKMKDLRRWRKDILFSFTQSSTGKPRVHWGDNKPIPGRTTIDLLRIVAVYIDKPPPVRNEKLLRLEIDGEPIVDGVPYQSGEVRGGMRIYLDGIIQGVIKRKTLGEQFLIPGSDVAGDPRWTLVPFLESLGVRWSEVRTVDLIYDDAVVGRIEPKDLAKTTFSAIPDKGGQVILHPQEITVAAILLYARAAPPDPR